MSESGQQAWLGLGGNIGDVQQAMAEALRLLNDHDGITVDKVSPIYKTPPWGVEDQPWFLNCCAAVRTTLSPEGLLAVCQTAEQEDDQQNTNCFLFDVHVFSLKEVCLGGRRAVTQAKANQY